MLVVMAAELSAEANRQILVLREFYNGIAEYLHESNAQLPSNSNQIPFESEQLKSREIPKEAELILKLANAPFWEERTIIEEYQSGI